MDLLYHLPRYACLPFVLVAAAAIADAQLTTGQISFPANFMTSVKTYGAVGDGITDDTAAIQSALADGRSNTTNNYYFGRPKALYFPPGVYLVSNTLQWAGCCVTLQGAGPSVSVIRLALGSSGFGDPANPKPLILSPAGNESFRQNIWDLAIDVGSNNPGATALSYVSNNVGSVHDVRISSDDGHGRAGIDLTRAWAGPLLIRSTEIDGFDVGVDLANAEYSSTFEAITLQNQNIVGIQNANQSISIRGLTSNNRVPAINNKGGLVVLLDGSLKGGSQANFALETDHTMYLRNVTSSGYQATLFDERANTITTGTIEEILAGSPKSAVYSAPSGSLKLPVAATPSFTSSSLTDWEPFVPRWPGDSAPLQATLDSGKNTIYFPFGVYNAWHDNSVTVPDTVQRIVAFSSVINTTPTGDGIRFVVNSNSTTPLIIEQFGYGLKIDHHGNRPVVIKDSIVRSYNSFPGAGDLYLEDVEMPAFIIQASQHVWARQLDDEAMATKVTNAGGSLWILGLKTEQASSVIDTAAGGNSELLGGLIYPATSVPATNIAFNSNNANISYIYKQDVYCANCGYAIQIQDKCQARAQRVTSTIMSFRVSLFGGSCN